MDKEKAQQRRIRHALENADCSFTEIARLVGVSPSHVSHVAAGRRVSGPVRQAIVRALDGVDPFEQSDDNAA